MICPNCKKQIPDGSAFCGYCGREIPKVPLCTRCGAALRPNDRFCGVCGAPVEAPADTNKAELTVLEQQLAQRREAMASLRRELEEQTEALKAARETLEAERAEQARLAEEKRKAEEARLAEEKRKAEEARLAEEKRKAEEAARLAEEKRKAEEARLAEEKRKAEEAAHAQAEAEAKAKEEAEARAAVEKQPEQTEAEPEKPVKKTGGKKTGWLVAAVLVLALAAAALAAVYSSGGELLLFVKDTELLPVEVKLIRESGDQGDWGVTIQEAQCWVEGGDVVFHLTCKLPGRQPAEFCAFSPPNSEEFSVSGTITAESSFVDIYIPVEKFVTAEYMGISISTVGRPEVFWLVNNFQAIKSRVERYMKVQAEAEQNGDADVDAALPTLAEAVVPGDTIAFGHYEQDNDTSNGPEAITWKVLACESDTALLISEQVLDYLPYDTNGSARWDTSSLRAELNGTFYDSAFSDEEKAVMTTSSAEPYDNPVTGVQDDSAATEDMVFIPSLKQANDYFQDALARVTWGTAYAVAHAREQASALGETLAEDFGGSASRGTSWLLRTPSQNDDTVVFVHDEACDPENSNDYYHRGEEDWGYACSLSYCFWGKNVSSFQVGVRPCIRVRIPAADTADTVGDLSSVKVGDFITVGRYEQDNNLTNGPEPIEWRVLDKKDGKLLVISDKSLYESSFAYLGWQPVPQNWESSCARGWLNNYFMQTAFTPAEQARVVLTNVHTEPTEGSPIDPGPDTQDYMFLLSGQEASAYFPTAESRRTKTTAYALSRRSESRAHQGFDGDLGDWRTNVSFWLLRSPARKPNWVYGAAYIYDYTTPYGEPGDVWYHDGRDTGDIRPAMWIEAKPAADASAYPSALPDAVVPGDTITFGHYEQDNDTSNGPEAITWKVLDVQDGKALVISEKILARVRHRYVEDGHGAVTWETSRVRQWLSEDFFEAAFSDEEKTAVCLTNVKSEPNPDYTDTDPGKDTQDYVFVLGLEQYDAYFADDGDLFDAIAPYTEVARVGNPYAKDELVRTAKYYPMNNAVRGNADGSAGWWWLRTVGQDYAADGNFMMRVDAAGKADGVGSDADCGVRPAMWVDVDALTNVTDAC